VKGKVSLYSVELSHVDGQPYVCILVAHNKREAVEKVRRQAQFRWSAGRRDFTLSQCVRLDAVDGYEIVLKETSTNAAPST
jgi:hypothetical protein